LENGLLLKEALQTNYFRIVVVQDAEVVESCGALKVSQIEHLKLLSNKR
jgi:glycerol-3-phosphate dehydrogenase